MAGPVPVATARVSNRKPGPSDASAAADTSSFWVLAGMRPAAALRLASTVAPRRTTKQTLS